MKHDLPTPEQILEELADKTAAQIDRLASVAFDGAWREMTRYHRFLLALNAAQTADGTPISYAQVPGYALSGPHRDWLRQYGRLFERAANRLPDDAHFIRTLAYAPNRLLPRPGAPELPTDIVKGILDLVPMMMHRLEAWVTKRTTIETPKGHSAEPRLVLAGSDAKAYANVLPDLIGAWESLLQSAPSTYGWREWDARSDDERWSALAASWPFLWQHLTNTAYCLALTVWNEDEPGAALFREALVRWPKTLHQLDDEAELRRRRYLFPDVVTLSWSEASARAAPLAFDYMPAPTPAQLFASVVSRVHDDVLLLTAGLLLFWTISDKQASDIGGRTALALLKRVGGGDDRFGSVERDLSLQALFSDLLRFEIAGERFNDGSYGAELDRLVEILDNMTERRVVPGRVFTPSTLHGREGLLHAFGAILAAAAPDAGDDGLLKAIATLAGEEELLPKGDQSLRNITHELGRFRSMLEHPPAVLARGVAVLASDRDVDHLTGQLREVVGSAAAMVDAARLQRLRDRPIDPATLERIRSAVEAALLTGPAEAPFFRDVRIERAPRDDATEWHIVAFSRVAKAQLVDPPMESVTAGFEETFASNSREAAGRQAWAAFTRRPRVEMEVGAKVEQEEFWRDIAPLIARVGPDPVLVVSQTAEGRALRRLAYSGAEQRPRLRIEHRPSTERAGSYIATVESVDVFGADFSAGVAWLFSAHALQSIRYAALENPECYVGIDFELGDDVQGTLRLRYRQQLEWIDTPIFELRTPDPEESEDAAS